LKHLFLSILVVIITSCSSVKNYLSDESSISISSKQKDVQVYVFSNNENDYVLIGSTPLEISTSKLKEKTGSSKATISLKLEKVAYVTENILYAERSSERLSLNINLKKIINWSNGRDLNTSSIMNDSWGKLQKINKSIRQKKYKQANLQVDQLISVYPYAPILFDIKGSVLYLMNKPNEAKQQYSRAREMRQKI
jgi:hypothetical protein